MLSFRAPLIVCAYFLTEKNMECLAIRQQSSQEWPQSREQCKTQCKPKANSTFVFFTPFLPQVWR